MKLKYYLRGLGLGIICTTIILSIEFNARGNKISDQEIIERAERLGMTMQEEEASGTVLEEQEEENDKEAAQETDKATDPTAKDQKEKSESKGKTKKKDVDEKNDKDSKKTASKKNDTAKNEKKDKPDENPPVDATPPETVDFVVNSGEYSDIVSRNLFTQNLVDNAEAFNAYIVENHFDVLLQPGVYAIPKGSDYATIAQILTTPVQPAP